LRPSAAAKAINGLQFPAHGTLIGLLSIDEKILTVVLRGVLLGEICDHARLEGASPRSASRL